MVQGSADLGFQLSDVLIKCSLFGQCLLQRRQL